MYYRSGTVAHVTRARQSSGQPADAAAYEAVSGRRTSWPISDFVNRFIFTRRTILTNFISPIRLETTYSPRFFEEVAPRNKNNNNKMSSDMRSVPDPTQLKFIVYPTVT